MMVAKVTIRIETDIDERRSSLIEEIVQVLNTSAYLRGRVMNVESGDARLTLRTGGS